MCGCIRSCAAAGSKKRTLTRWHLVERAGVQRLLDAARYKRALYFRITLRILSRDLFCIQYSTFAYLHRDGARVVLSCWLVFFISLFYSSFFFRFIFPFRARDVCCYIRDGFTHRNMVILGYIVRLQ